MNRKQQVARVQFCVAAHLRKVGKKDGNGCLYRVLCVELLGGRADDLRKQNSNWLNEGYFPDVLGVLLGLILIPVAILKKLCIH